jgi:hypothetical protein
LRTRLPRSASDPPPDAPEVRFDRGRCVSRKVSITLPYLDLTNLSEILYRVFSRNRISLSFLIRSSEICDLIVISDRRISWKDTNFRFYQAKSKSISNRLFE